MVKSILIIFAGYVGFISNRNTGCPTGPAHAYYSIDPIGYSDKGVVLCRTQWMENSSGAQMIMPETYGYLLVSAGGLWIEKSVTVLDDLTPYDSISKFRKKFYTEIDLKNPPRELTEIVNSYKINHKTDTLSRGKYYWTKNGIYNTRNRLVSYHNRQKTITGLKNVPGKGIKVYCNYAIKGVLFFENRSDFDDGDRGACFHMGTEFGGTIGMYGITGICVLKPIEKK